MLDQAKWIVGGLCLAAAAPAHAGNIPFAPHRAVYDFNLIKSSPGSGVTDLKGRMVYELTGSQCEGFTQNMRFVTRRSGQDGQATVDDLRTSSYEEGPGHRLRFTSSQYSNDKLDEATQGDAERESDAVRTVISKPARKAISLPVDLYFPIQHSMAVVEQARNGKSIFGAKLYDGSDKGEKYYATTAVIGQRSAPGAIKMPAALKQGERLAAEASWPISVGYFEPGAGRQDSVPTYEISYRFYENGVSDNIMIDYGGFAMRGELSQIVFLDPVKCPPAKR